MRVFEFQEEFECCYNKEMKCKSTLVTPAVPADLKGASKGEEGRSILSMLKLELSNLEKTMGNSSRTEPKVIKVIAGSSAPSRRSINCGTSCDG